MNTIDKFCRIFTLLTVIGITTVSLTGVPGTLKYHWSAGNLSVDEADSNQQLSQANELKNNMSKSIAEAREKNFNPVAPSHSELTPAKDSKKIADASNGKKKVR